MPKPKFIVSDYYRNELLRCICVKIGFPIRTKLDCRKVSQLIHDSQLPTISESTIYRLFLWNGKNNTPYIHTLDILSRFCGFPSWSKFELHQQELDTFAQGYGRIQINGTPIKSLIEICIHTDKLKPLYSYAEQFPKDVDFDKKIMLGQEIFKSLISNPNENLKFFKNFHTLPIIRESFFEIFADPRFRIPNYEAGIEYYLRNLKPTENIRDLQDTLFGNCLLFRYHFIQGNRNKALKIGKILFTELELLEKDLLRIHIFPVARYFSCKILHYKLLGQTKKSFDYLEEVFNFILKNQKKWNLEEQRIVFFNLGEAILLHSEIPISQHTVLKALFPELFSFVPQYYSNSNLKEIIPYLDCNSSSIFH